MHPKGREIKRENENEENALKININTTKTNIRRKKKLYVNNMLALLECVILAFVAFNCLSHSLTLCQVSRSTS